MKKSFPLSLLFVLLLALCGLCGVQWWRESQLRQMAATQRDALLQITTKRDELESRVKAADAEILRINASLAELRANSISKQVHEEALQANTMLRDTISKQNTAIIQQNEALQKQNEAMQKANATITRLAAERDDMVKRLNEVTAKYNALIKTP